MSRHVEVKWNLRIMSERAHLTYNFLPEMLFFVLHTFKAMKEKLS